MCFVKSVKQYIFRRCANNLSTTRNLQVVHLYRRSPELPHVAISTSDGYVLLLACLSNNIIHSSHLQ